MGVQNPQTIPFQLRRAPDGYLTGGYVPIDPDNAWRIASAFRLQRTDTLAMVTHLSSAGSMAAWRWASTNHEYRTRLGFRGGEPPFRVTLLESPTSAKVGVAGKQQVWTRTQSLVDPNLYIHSMPSRMNEISWSPSLSDVGTTQKFRVRIESADGQVLEHIFYAGVDNSKFYYFSPTGSDSNSGLFGSPWQTFGKGYSTAGGQNRIHCYYAGTYNVHNGTPGNDAAFDSTHCLSHIGIEDGVIFNTDGGSLSAGIADISLINITTTGGNPAMQSGNVRQINLTNRSNRFYSWKVTGDTTVIGNNGGDNPACIFLADLSSSIFHEDVAILDCVTPATAKTQHNVLFQVDKFIIENLVSLSPTLPASNGPVIFGLKDGVRNGTVRMCDIVASTPNLLTNWYSQDWVNCGNIDMHYCRFVNLNTASNVTMSFNDQVDTAPKEKPINYWVQRCSIDALNGTPFSFKNYTGLGYPVNYSANLWKSTASTIDGGTTGGLSVGTSSLKVSDINNISAANLGVRGHLIASTLVT